MPVPALLPTPARACSSCSTGTATRDSVIFGHAKDGNIHFMLTEQLRRRGATRPLPARSPRTWSTLVLGHGGSLKAEHGTGRIMAPFVRRQYGDELYDVMREIKRLCDPRGMLNPGVVLIDDDPTAHLQPPQADPDGRGRGRPLRRVRLLRAGLPQPAT